VKAPKPITARQMSYLASLGVPASKCRDWTRSHASAEIKLRLLRKDTPPLSPVGPKLHGVVVAAESTDYRLVASRALTGPQWL
jgi:hypothetical protein